MTAALPLRDAAAARGPSGRTGTVPGHREGRREGRQGRGDGGGGAAAASPRSRVLAGLGMQGPLVPPPSVKAAVPTRECRQGGNSVIFKIANKIAGEGK